MLFACSGKLLYAEAAALALLFLAATAIVSFRVVKSDFSASDIEIVADEEAAQAPATSVAPRVSRFQIDAYPVFGPVPWAHLTQRTRDDFTLKGKIKVMGNMIATKLETSSPVWTTAQIDGMVKLVNAGQPNVGRQISKYGPVTNGMFFRALKEWPVQGLHVLVVGSRDPWVEAFCLAFGAANVTTVDFNAPKVDDPRIQAFNVAQLDASDTLYDAVFSYSSLEHDGLGRYGDPINPWGDLERMKKLKTLLKPEGKLYLGVPNGNDTIVFNAHRIYGLIRFPMLIEGWKLLKTYAHTPMHQLYNTSNGYFEQPLHVLSLPKPAELSEHDYSDYASA